MQHRLNLTILFDRLSEKKCFKMVVLSIFTITTPFASINFTITPTNILSDSIVFIFSNVTITRITTIMNITISSHNKILIISISIMIISFKLLTMIIIKSSKKNDLKQNTSGKLKKIQLTINTNLQNKQNKSDCGNSNTGINNLNPIDPTTVGIDSIVMLFFVFKFDIVNNEFQNANELKFKFENENVDCSDFFNAITVFNSESDCDALSSPMPSPSHTLPPTIFDFNGTSIGLLGNNDLEWIFNVTNNTNDNYNGTHSKRTSVEVCAQVTHC